MTKDDGFWVNTGYIVLAVLVGYVAFEAIGTLGIQLGWAERYDSWFPLVRNLCAVVLGAGSAYWFRSDADRQEYHLASVAEVRKVRWPSYPDTKRMTVIVVVVVAVFSAILGVFDLVWSWLLKKIIAA